MIYTYSEAIGQDYLALLENLSEQDVSMNMQEHTRNKKCEKSSRLENSGTPKPENQLGLKALKTTNANYFPLTHPWLPI